MQRMTPAERASARAVRHAAQQACLRAHGELFDTLRSAPRQQRRAQLAQAWPFGGVPGARGAPGQMPAPPAMPVMAKAPVTAYQSFAPPAPPNFDTLASRRQRLRTLGTPASAVPQADTWAAPASRFASQAHAAWRILRALTHPLRHTARTLASQGYLRPFV